MRYSKTVDWRGFAFSKRSCQRGLPQIIFESSDEQMGRKYSVESDIAVNDKPQES